jgi:flagellar export protein FliJ
MKAFNFSLEQVRRWRNEQADVEDLKLQKIDGELHALNASAEQVRAEADQAWQTVMGGASVVSHELSQLDGFRDYARAKLKQLAEQTAECEKRAGVQRQKLIEARRQFELLDRLKKKALAEWRLSRDKEQEEAAAELYLAKLSRDRD